MFTIVTGVSEVNRFPWIMPDCTFKLEFTAKKQALNVRVLGVKEPHFKDVRLHICFTALPFCRCLGSLFYI